jgi:hypothetical protein
MSRLNEWRDVLLMAGAGAVILTMLGLAFTHNQQSMRITINRNCDAGHFFSDRERACLPGYRP